METEARQQPEDFGIGRLFYVTSEAIVAADLAAEQIVLWNPAAEALFGYTVDEALGMPLDRLVPDDLKAAHFGGIRRYRSGAEAVLVGAGAVEVPAMTKSGTRLDIALSLSDVSVEGASRYVLAVIRDVTSQRRAERELAATNQAMREFVATASHDLRTPLASILGFARHLTEHGNEVTDAQRSDALRAIRRGAQHASHLVDDLLTLSQIQAGALTARSEPVMVAAAVREAKVRSGSSAHIEIDERLTVHADPDHLERILVNYLTNAERYGAEPVRVTAEGDEEHVVIQVIDVGAGVPEAFVERMFESFSRADPSASEGTGLGLSIVRGLALANGGEAFYERRTPGSCFAIRLPVDAGAAPA